MYLEILTVANLGDEVTTEMRVFVGPFETETARSEFRDYWEAKAGNSAQVKFLSQEVLPEGWTPFPPNEFRGFLHVQIELPPEEE